MFERIWRAFFRAFVSWRSLIGAVPGLIALAGSITGRTPVLPQWGWWALAYLALIAVVLQTQMRLDDLQEAKEPERWDMSGDLVLERGSRHARKEFGTNYTMETVMRRVVDRLRQEAINGKVHAWAQRGDDTALIRVTADEWERNRLSVDAALGPDPSLGGGQTKFEDGSRHNFRFVREEIDRIWPPPKRRLKIAPIFRWESEP